MSGLKENYSAIDRRIREACARAGRSPEDIRLIWVSKNQPREKILEALSLGARYFGENRVQEAGDKFPLPAGPSDGTFPAYALHFIGRLQTNKIRKVLPLAAAIHSIDSIDLLAATDRVAGELELVRDVFLQVNTSRETAKGGFAPETLVEILRTLTPPRHLRIVGLMTMGPTNGNSATTRACFHELAGLFQEIRREPRNTEALRNLRWLSMGMTGDFETAIEEGAHFLRIGTGLFGERPVALG